MLWCRNFNYPCFTDENGRTQRTLRSDLPEGPQLVHGRAVVEPRPSSCGVHALGYTAKSRCMKTRSSYTSVMLVSFFFFNTIFCQQRRVKNGSVIWEKSPKYPSGHESRWWLKKYISRKSQACRNGTVYLLKEKVCFPLVNWEYTHTFEESSLCFWNEMLWNKTWITPPVPNHSTVISRRLVFPLVEACGSHPLYICLLHRGERSGSEFQLAEAYSWLLTKSRTKSVEGISLLTCQKHLIYSISPEPV